jgi:hypothetical protein
MTAKVRDLILNNPTAYAIAWNGEDWDVLQTQEDYSEWLALAVVFIPLIGEP